MVTPNPETDHDLMSGSIDPQPAIPLEIREETAARTDDLLRELAEDAGLETALVVARSGALVAGISSEADVTVDVISALVAGASGAMRALVDQLGETGSMESLHLGENRLVYLRETVNRFILVAVAEASRPAGLVREKAGAIESALAEILREVRSVDFPPIPAPSSPRYREFPRSAAAPDTPAIAEPGRTEEPSKEEVPGDSETESSEPPSLGAPAISRDEPEPVEETPGEVAPSAVATPPPIPAEPREILEPLDFGEPEILVERTVIPPVAKLPVDSPFEEDDWEDEPEEASPNPEPSTDIGGETETETFSEGKTAPELPEPPGLPGMDGDPEPRDRGDEEAEAEAGEDEVTEAFLTEAPPVLHSPAVFEFDEDGGEDDQDEDEVGEEPRESDSEGAEIATSGPPPLPVNQDPVARSEAEGVIGFELDDGEDDDEEEDFEMEMVDLSEMRSPGAWPMGSSVPPFFPPDIAQGESALETAPMTDDAPLSEPVEAPVSVVEDTTTAAEAGQPTGIDAPWESAEIEDAHDPAEAAAEPESDNGPGEQPESGFPAEAENEDEDPEPELGKSGPFYF